MNCYDLYNQIDRGGYRSHFAETDRATPAPSHTASIHKEDKCYHLTKRRAKPSPSIMEAA